MFTTLIFLLEFQVHVDISDGAARDEGNNNNKGLHIGACWE